MTQQDAIARIIDAAMGHPDDHTLLTPVTELGEWNAGTIAEALVAAGLIVPDSMTAEKLRRVLRIVRRTEPTGSATAVGHRSGS